MALKPASTPAQTQSPWSRLAPGMYCVCDRCAREFGWEVPWQTGPGPVPHGTQPAGPNPGQWDDHCQQMWLEDIFIQGVFKDLCSCDFLFFLFCCGVF